MYYISIDGKPASNTTSDMKQKKKKKKINTTKTGKMVSFRMSWACVDQLQALADATGNSKSEVLRSGLDALKKSCFDIENSKNH